MAPPGRGHALNPPAEARKAEEDEVGMKRPAAAMIASVMLASCSGGEPAAPAGAAAATETPEVAFHTGLSLKEVMGHVMDAAADGVWLRQGWEITSEGEREKFPTTDEEWLAAENAALTVAESANLLLLPGRIQDGPEWVGYTKDLYDAAIAAQAAAEVRDKQAFFDAGGAMYIACRECHRVYIIGEDPSER